MSAEAEVTPGGNRRYNDNNSASFRGRSEYIGEVVKKWKFDTIAVHEEY